MINEFKNLMDQHKKTYDLVKQVKSVLNSADTFKVIDELKLFNKYLDKVIEESLSVDEKVLLPLLDGKSHNKSSNIDCYLAQHKKIYKKNETLHSLLEEYENNPTNNLYQSIIEESSKITDELYNYAYAEDSLLSAFEGIEISESEKREVAKELAKISCEFFEE